ncbi:MAG: type IV secretion system DNA-binding domain-containing protein [Hydrococcus sp. Prado102]|jgi:hypothetical protein|nr:type IV secretion system DNA-binding domain-containing protein [Hydrococcus sp. Prado102]
MTRRNSSSNSGWFEFFLVLAALLFMLWAVHNQKVALLLFQNPNLILPYLIQEIGLFWVVVGVVGILALLWFLVASSAPASNVLRGAITVSSRKLKALLKREPKLRNQPQLSIAGMPIPAEYENRGFFFIGSPGSGKTLAISQIIAILRNRSDFRAIVFDRGGELLEKFFDPTKDIIFNPHDARSCHWSHIHEKAHPETIAAGLIPMESTREPFFSDAGRIVMAELFSRTRSNAELFKPLYTLAFELMLKGLLSEHERTRKTAIVIDELGALNKLPSLNRLLSESRRFLGCPILGTQTEAQITRVYGQEDTRILLQGTKTKLILNCSDPQTAEKMAQVIGKQERVELTNNRNRSRSSSSRGAGSGSSYGENEQLREAYAVMPSELQDLPDLKGYLRISSFPTAQVKVKVRNFPVQAERFIPRSQVSERTDTNAQSIQEQWKRLRSPISED